MRSRPIRFAFNGLCLLSLPACLAAAGLEWRCRRGAALHVTSAAVSRVRYTVRAEAGRLVLYAPPPEAPAARGWAANAVAAAEASSLRNDDVAWFVLTDRGAGPDGGTRQRRVSPRLNNPTFFALRSYTRFVPGADRALLAALEDPDRFAAAHVALVLRAGHLWEVPAVAGGRGVTASYDGMRLDLACGETHDSGTGAQCYQDCVGPWVDRSQLPALRARWHRRLDVPIRSVALSKILEATAALPLLWLAFRVGSRRSRVMRRRRRLGLCLRCGYDLTGNASGRCSECGEEVGSGSEKVTV